MNTIDFRHIERESVRKKRAQSREALKAASEKQAELRRAGKLERLDPIEQAKRSPQSKRKALRAYYWDWTGCAINRPVPKEMREEYKSLCEEAKGNYRPTIDKICFECVGAGADPNPPRLIRDCECTDCPLHPVRPHQKLKGRGKHAREASPGAFNPV